MSTPAPAEFDPLAWCAEQVEQQGNALARLLTTMDMTTTDRQTYIVVHSAVSQLAQVHKTLRAAVAT